jgi:hypothetical protein
MVKNPKRLAEFELEELKKESIPYAEALKRFEGLWQEGIVLGVLPPKNPLEGIETDIRIARILNSCTRQL